MKSKAMSSTLLEKLLIFAVFVIVAGIFGIFFVASDFAKSRAQAANNALTKAASTQKEIDETTAAYRWIEDNPVLVDKTNKLVAEAQSYKYQEQVINDLERYASQSDVQLRSYTFSDNTTASGATGESSSSSSTTPAAGAAATTPTTGATGGMKTATVQIGFGDGIGYSSFLKFLKRVENNVTRMQVTSLTLSPDAENQGLVQPEMTISVFLNQ